MYSTISLFNESFDTMFNPLHFEYLEDRVIQMFGTITYSYKNDKYSCCVGSEGTGKNICNIKEQLCTCTWYNTRVEALLGLCVEHRFNKKIKEAVAGEFEWD